MEDQRKWIIVRKGAKTHEEMINIELLCAIANKLIYPGPGRFSVSESVE